MSAVETEAARTPLLALNEDLPVDAEERVASIRRLIRDARLDEAHEAVMSMLSRRTAAGDTELESASLLLQHYITVILRLPPLSHRGIPPLIPDNRLYTCFEQFIDLIRRQEVQIGELQAMLAELL